MNKDRNRPHIGDIMDSKRIKWLLKSAKQHIEAAKHAKAIGWTEKGDLYEYSVKTAEEQLEELGQLVMGKEGQPGEAT